MAASYITTGDVRAVIGSTLLTELFDEGSGFVATHFTRCVKRASAMVESAALNAGYTLGDSTTNETVKNATLGAFIRIAFGRKQLRAPDDYQYMIDLVDRIRTGDEPIPGVTPNARDAVGGCEFSETDTSIDGNRHQIFSRSLLEVY